LNCALGLSQLKKINFFLKRRRKIYEKYLKEFKNLNKRLIVPKYSSNIKPSYHLFLLNIAFDKIKKSKDHFMKYLNKQNILAQQHYIPIYKFDIYKGKLNNFYGSEKYFKNSISIPIFVNLNNKDQKKIINVIKNYFKR
jgi:dTDP-4-amino-4,6-dideoxygalactose transaminase